MATATTTGTTAGAAATASTPPATIAAPFATWLVLVPAVPADTKQASSAVNSRMISPFAPVHALSHASRPSRMFFFLQVNSTGSDHYWAIELFRDHLCSMSSSVRERSGSSASISKRRGSRAARHCGVRSFRVFTNARHTAISGLNLILVLRALLSGTGMSDHDARHGAIGRRPRQHTRRLGVRRGSTREGRRGRCGRAFPAGSFSAEFAPEVTQLDGQKKIEKS